MQDIKIINYVVISGETVTWDELSKEEQNRAAETICDVIMESAGYVRMPAGELDSVQDIQKSRFLHSDGV